MSKMFEIPINKKKYVNFNFKNLTFKKHVSNYIQKHNFCLINLKSRHKITN